MGILNILDPALAFILSPVLKLNILLGIIVLSVVLSVLVTLAYKWTTNQELMKSLKDDLKSLQKEAQKLQKEDPQKALEKQKVLMQKNMEYMKHSFKSTFYTIIPLLLIFGWMQSTIAYMPIQPGEEFGVTLFMERGYRGMVTAETPEGFQIIGNATQEADQGRVQFTFVGDKVGTYDLLFDAEGEVHSKDVIISTWRDYAPVLKTKKGTFASLFGWLYTSKASYLDPQGIINQIMIENKPVQPFGNLSIFGWNPGWLAAYIFFSLLTSIATRKLLKVY